VSDWRHILVREVSSIAIPGQRLLERREWSFGDIQGSAGGFSGTFGTDLWHDTVWAIT
jgi:hypothetical protein